MNTPTNLTRPVAGIPCRAVAAPRLIRMGQPCGEPVKGYSDGDGERIRQFLARIAPANNSFKYSEAFDHGLNLIERLAASRMGRNVPYGEEVPFTRNECIDVLYFLSVVMPIGEDWEQDREKDAPSHIVGQSLVLCALEESLRAAGGRHA